MRSIGNARPGADTGSFVAALAQQGYFFPSRPSPGRRHGVGHVPVICPVALRIRSRLGRRVLRRFKRCRERNPRGRSGRAWHGLSLSLSHTVTSVASGAKTLMQTGPALVLMHAQNAERVAMLAAQGSLHPSTARKAAVWVGTHFAARSSVRCEQGRGAGMSIQVRAHRGFVSHLVRRLSWITKTFEQAPRFENPYPPNARAPPVHRFLRVGVEQRAPSVACAQRSIAGKGPFGIGRRGRAAGEPLVPQSR